MSDWRAEISEEKMKEAAEKFVREWEEREKEKERFLREGIDGAMARTFALLKERRFLDAEDLAYEKNESLSSKEFVMLFEAISEWAELRELVGEESDEDGFTDFLNKTHFFVYEGTRIGMREVHGQGTLTQMFLCLDADWFEEIAFDFADLKGDESVEIQFENRARLEELLFAASGLPVNPMLAFSALEAEMSLVLSKTDRFSAKKSSERFSFTAVQGRSVLKIKSQSERHWAFLLDREDRFSRAGAVLQRIAEEAKA